MRTIYSNFVKISIRDNNVTTINCKLLKINESSKIYCHAFDELTNSTIRTINSRSLEIQKPISFIMTLYVKINDVESIRTYDISNYLTSNVNFSIDIWNLKDINGITLAQSGTISLSTVQYNNIIFTIASINSKKYKNELLSFYIKPTDNLEIIDESFEGDHNIEDFDFNPLLISNEGDEQLTIDVFPTDNLEIRFSLDGENFDYAFNYDYWESPEGIAEIEEVAGITFPLVYRGHVDEDGNLLSIMARISHVPQLQEPDNQYIMLPFTHYYFWNIITGNKSITYDFTIS